MQADLKLVVEGEMAAIVNILLVPLAIPLKKM